MQLSQELDTIVHRITGHMFARFVFAQSSPNPGLSQEVAWLLRPHIVSGEEPLPIDVECRGVVCALRPNSAVPESKMRWACPPSAEPAGACVGGQRGDWWFAKLWQQQRKMTFIERITSPEKRYGEEFPTYITIRPPEQRLGVLGREMLVKLARIHHFAEIVADCEGKYPDKGILTIAARVPDTCVPSSDSHKKITVEYGGELVASRLVDCIRNETQDVLSRWNPDACTYADFQEWNLQFPHPKIEFPIAK